MHTGSTVILDSQVGDDFPEVSSKLKSGKRNRNCSVVSNYFLVREYHSGGKTRDKIYSTQRNIL